MATEYLSVFADDGYEDWQPIPSTVTDQQLAALEKDIGHRLPADYRSFLQYKHFYELHIGQADFFPHPVQGWSKILKQEMLLNWPIETRQARLIPFASWGGAGDMLCFKMPNQLSAVDCSVVLWNHEDGNTEHFSASFTTLLPKLLAELPERAM